MGRFEIAVEDVIGKEGKEITDDKDDRGGLTKYGISQAAYPDEDIRNLTRERAIEIYRARWDAGRYNDLPEGVGEKMFVDLDVNMGKKTAGFLLQMALMDMGESLTIDGIIGDETISVAGIVHPKWLLDKLRLIAARRYVDIVKRDDKKVDLYQRSGDTYVLYMKGFRSQLRYLLGWLDKRALS